MKLLLILLLITLCSWTEIRYEDFKATPPKYTEHAALTCVRLDYSYSVKNGIVVANCKLVFLHNQSWIKVKTPYILEHERLHVAIAELHRQLFLDVAKKELTPSNVKSNFYVLVKVVNEAMEEMQKLYDLETDHSNNYDRQMEWGAKLPR